MWIHLKKATINGRTLPKEKLNWWEVLEEASHHLDTLKLNPDDDVIGRQSEEFEKEHPITNGSDLEDYLFANYRYSHHLKTPKKVFRSGEVTLHLSFS